MMKPQDPNEPSTQPGSETRGEGSPLWERSQKPTAEPTPRKTERPFLGLARSLLLLLAVVIAGGLLVFFLRSLIPRAPVADLKLDGRIALLPFANATGQRDLDWVSVGLTAMASEALGRTPGVEVVPAEDLLREIKIRSLQADNPADRQHIVRLARALGARLVVDGSLRRIANGVALDFEISNDSGVFVREELAGSHILEAADLLVISLARGLTSRGEPVLLERTFSSKPFLDQLYGMGLAELQSDAAIAAPYFQIALRAQPHFLHAKVGAFECKRRLGQLQEFRELARQVLEEAQSRGDRHLQIRSLKALALSMALEGSSEAAEELYRQAKEILLRLEDRSGMAQVLSHLTLLALARGDRDHAEELMSQRLELQAALGDRLGRIETLIEQGSLFLNKQNPEAAEQALQEARDLALDLDDPWTEMRIVASMGEVAQHQGNHVEAQEYWQRALTFYQQQRDQPRQLLLSDKLARSMLNSERYTKAEDLLYEVVELAQELNRPAIEATASLKLTWLLLRAGYPLQARTHLDRTLELDRWLVEDRLSLQLVIAWFAYEQGNFRLAAETLTEAKRQAGEDWRPLDETFLNIFNQAYTLGERLPLPSEPEYSSR